MDNKEFNQFMKDDQKKKKLMSFYLGEFGRLIDKINRKGNIELKYWLESETDFLNAPASTKYHGSNEGGLLEHSIIVHSLLEEKNKRYNLGLSEETVIICGLLHDVCKTNFYKRNGIGYKVDDQFPVGHGEKSVFLLQRFIELTDQEIAMIRWHMVAFDVSIHFDYPNGYAFRSAVKKWPQIVFLFTADYEASALEDFTVKDLSGHITKRGDNMVDENVNEEAKEETSDEEPKDENSEEKKEDSE